MNIRINDIECRKTIHTKTREYEIIKWYKNSYYGTEKELLDKGYKRVEYEDGDWGMAHDNHTINSSCFKNPYSCYVIAWLEPNPREPDINLITVGSRLLDLSDEDRETFFRVYKISQELIMEEMSKEEK